MNHKVGIILSLSSTLKETDKGGGSDIIVFVSVIPYLRDLYSCIRAQTKFCSISQLVHLLGSLKALTILLNQTKSDSPVIAEIAADMFFQRK